MTPAKLSRRHKNRLATYARGVCTLLRDNPRETFDHLHDALMRAYAEGWTHGEAAEREKDKTNDMA